MGTERIPRQFLVSFRLNGFEAAALDAARDTHNISRSRGDYARALVLHYLKKKVPEPAKPAKLPARRLPSYDRQELSKILGQLGKIGSNINQIARFANQSEEFPEIDLINQIQADIAAIRDDVTSALSGREKTTQEAAE
ncbi:plasmid mobilization relaxosome protein MobC [Candidatus Terasakiella magnetica]|uniref:plasmid mobilization relaxosome protein MobC n=1 Tax=Candidatus Terasakiella magnetica TaxID=1867952 RepID=UPI000840FB64|nr:plasmid mobilization relaxosome protein MobC [Candidatus Terasakiella magnetica]